jgi:hypothetical protein
MSVTKLKLPASITTPLTDYADKILDTPGKYVQNSVYSTGEFTDTNIDKNDPTLPGVSDEFILAHALDSVYWNDRTLHKGIFVNTQMVSYPPMDISMKLIAWLSKELKSTFVEPRGNFLYNTGSFMGWHTNSDIPGTRVYVAYSQQDNGSYFKYVDRSGDTPKIITDWDTKGWNVRVFNPYGVPTNYLWHCVDAPNAPRISFGYKFK